MRARKGAVGRGGAGLKSAALQLTSRKLRELLIRLYTPAGRSDDPTYRPALVGEPAHNGSAIAYLSWRRNRVPLALRQLIGSGVFAAAFGFLEAVVVVYLRAAAGVLPGYQGSLSDVIRLSGEFYQQWQGEITHFPQSLLTLEVFREIATILMLLSVAFLSSGTSRVSAAVFLWAFAIWDIVYYVALWATVRWPLSLNDPDVLFLIPVPWFSPVWFPLLVSGLAVAAVLLTRGASTKPP